MGDNTWSINYRHTVDHLDPSILEGCSFCAVREILEHLDVFSFSGLI